MGLMISSIARINKDAFPKNLFKSNSDYYLYILEYSNFDFDESRDYSSVMHGIGMSRVLNCYQYNFNNKGIEKLDSDTFHSNTIMNWRNIFDMENVGYKETGKTKITPAFLFTTLNTNELFGFHEDDIADNEFIFVRLNIQDRDANRVPQILNKMFSNVGETISKCTRANIDTQYSNVYVFDYCIDTKTNNTTYMKNEFNVGGDLKIEGSVIGANNKIIKTQKSDKKLSFWGVVWQSVVSNIILWILGVIATVLLMYWSIN